EVNPNLVAHNSQGQPESVHYEMVNAMLLNEFLKEHKTVQEQGATITELKQQIAALTASLQKGSAQLEVSKPARHTVLNKQHIFLAWPIFGTASSAALAHSAAGVGLGFGTEASGNNPFS